MSNDDSKEKILTTATATRTPHANDRDPENDNQHDNDRDYQHDNHQDNDQDNKINNRNNKNDEENKTRWWRKRQRWRRRDDTAADNNNTMAENKNNQPENKILSIAMMLSILCIIVLESQHLFENIIVVMVAFSKLQTPLEEFVRPSYDLPSNSVFISIPIPTIPRAIGIGIFSEFRVPEIFQ